MPKFQLTDWPETPAQAIALQKTLQSATRLKNDIRQCNIIAGVDVSYDLKTNLSRAVVVLFDYAKLEITESVMAHAPTLFPYVPGLLSFREIPVVIDALNMLSRQPDILMVDGQGIAHPRRLGFATHLGLITDIPSIGVAKSLLTGKFIEPGLQKGEQSELMDKGERIGTALRSKDKTKPLFISPGHRIDHEKSLEIVNFCLRGYRLPEPTRIADKYSKIRPPKPFINSL